MSWKKTNKERLLEAVEKRDDKTIIECAHTAEKVLMNLSYSQANFFSCLLSYVGEKFGDKAVEDGLMYVAEHTWKDGYSQILSDKKKVIDFWLDIYNCITFDFDMVEEKDKVTIIVNNCKTGGKVAKESKKIGVSRQEAEWCFNKKGIPYYCSHCKVNKEIIPKMMGYYDYEFECGVSKDSNGKLIQEPCKLIIHHARYEDCINN